MSFQVLCRGLLSRFGSIGIHQSSIPHHWKTATAKTASALSHPHTSMGLYSPYAFNSVVSTSVRTFATKKKKNLLRHTKGFRGRSKNCFRVAIRRLQKSWQYAFRDRRRKRREWSKLWIQRISAGVRQYSHSYSKFMGALNKSPLKLDRKVLAELAYHEPFAFRSVVQVVEHASKNNKAATAGAVAGA
ncbi:50S ribosomal protein L20p [Nitzschia inconspicua]|uniref:50S ribosomal protein L20p n=1 Tax=Nitzschia inconspicua TaxID=303405 RepID=A0A9K3KV96_9STRA|nr:50S ribosomal protein L20p [Nitzschia inconspicua]